MKQPSSTITAATLAGAGVSFGWELVSQFTSVDIRPSLIAVSVTFAIALVGYLKRENVLPVGNPL